MVQFGTPAPVYVAPAPVYAAPVIYRGAPRWHDRFDRHFHRDHRDFRDHRWHHDYRDRHAARQRLVKMPGGPRRFTSRRPRYHPSAYRVVCDNAAMRIWVDADACPNPIKEILFRAAERMKIAVTLVANKPLRTPPSALISAPSGGGRL